MAERRQFIRQSPADAEEFIGLEGELTIELETLLIRVHDGITPGGTATLTLASALAQFVTLTDFNAAIAQVITDVTVINDAAIDEIFGAILIAKGPVQSMETGPPGVPVAGDRFLIANSGTSGIFIGKENQVVEYLDGSTPIFSGAPSEGHQVYVQDVEIVYYFHGSVWLTLNPDQTYQLRQTAIDAAIALKADLASPALTGVPTAPTAAAATNTTQIATTAFVQQEITGQGIGGTLGTEGSISVGGAILKWGFYNGGSANPTINFAAAFPNVCYNVQCTPVGQGTDTPDEASTPKNVKVVGIQTFSATSFSAYVSGEQGVEDVFKADAAGTFYWTAIGR